MPNKIVDRNPGLSTHLSAHDSSSIVPAGGQQAAKPGVRPGYLPDGAFVPVMIGVGWVGGGEITIHG